MSNEFGNGERTKKCVCEPRAEGGASNGPRGAYVPSLGYTDTSGTGSRCQGTCCRLGLERWYRWDFTEYLQSIQDNGIFGIGRITVDSLVIAVRFMNLSLAMTGIWTSVGINW